MKKTSLITTLIVAAVILLNVTAYAAIYNRFPDVPAEANYAEAVDYLAELEIFKGDENGNFNPNSTITRAEFATIAVRMMGEEDRAKTITKSSFTDVPSTHWACGYVTVAVELGLVGGYGDGRYGPSDTLTYEQAVKILVCTMGYEDVAQQLGGWPRGYMTIADELEILQGTVRGSTATRAVVAMLTYNTITLSTGESGGTVE